MRPSRTLPLAPARSSRWWLWAIATVLLVALAVTGFMLPIGSWIADFRAWIDGFGAWGMAVFALAYILATIAMLPCAPLSVVAGLAWGAWALPLVLAAALAGASLAFQLARHVAQHRVQAWALTRPGTRAVIDAVGEEGWRIVLLLRLSVIVPFNMQNYLFGITSVGFVPYAIATAIGVLPGATLFITMGSLGHELQDGDGSGTLNWILFGVSLIATVAAVVLVTRRVVPKLRALESAHARPASGAPAPTA